MQSEYVMPPKVAEAVAKVMSKVGAIEKRGTNEYDRYKYATAADLFHALQKNMAEAGLVIVASEISYTVLLDSIGVGLFEFTLAHTSGETWAYRPRFSGMSRIKTKNGSVDDKAGNKCLVAAMKYFLLNLFKIPTGDYVDPDADGSGDDDKGKKDTPRHVSPPNAATGLPEPGFINVELNGKDHDWKGWAAKFISAVQSAGSAAEVTAWCDTNAMQIDALTTKADETLVQRFNAALAKAKGKWLGGAA